MELMSNCPSKCCEEVLNDRTRRKESRRDVLVFSRELHAGRCRQNQFQD